MSTDANARGPRPTLGHIWGLDGIRALSVPAVIAFHSGLNSVPGVLSTPRVVGDALSVSNRYSSIPA